MCKYGFGYANMHFGLRKYTVLVTQGYGRDESAPTPGGVFATHFVGERWYFTECLLVSCGVFCVYFVGVRNVIADRQQP